MITINELYAKGRSILKDFSRPDLEAKLLLLKCALISEEQFFALPDMQVSRKQERLFYRFVSKRMAGFPLAYLTGVKEFWSIPFTVFPGVLIPRPETELIVERVIELTSQEPEVILDIGTGSGNIAISLSKELPQATIIATDISRKALRAAKLNASLQKASCIAFLSGNMYVPLRKLKLEGKCNFIVSNPPYVSSREWKKLHKEIRDHEPKKALVAGETGLEMIQRLIEGAAKYLKDSGHLIFEVGQGMKNQVLSLFGPIWQTVDCSDDLNGVPRVIVARKKEQ